MLTAAAEAAAWIGRVCVGRVWKPSDVSGTGRNAGTPGIAVWSGSAVKMVATHVNSSGSLSAASTTRVACDFLPIEILRPVDFENGAIQ